LVLRIAVTQCSESDMLAATDTHEAVSDHSQPQALVHGLVTNPLAKGVFLCAKNLLG